MTGRQPVFRWQMNTDGPETYERIMVPVWMADWVDDLLIAGNIGRGTRVLDAACGTGIVARRAVGVVGPGGRVAALDLNEGMLRVAERCARDEGAAGIAWHRSDITRMPFPDGEFDTVLCQQGLQFFPDKTAALREMARVLAPGGRLAVAVWGRAEKSPHVPVICEVFSNYFGKESTAMFDVACSLCDPAVLHDLVEDAGFSNIRIQAGIKIARHPSLSDFLPAYFSIFPIAEKIGAMPVEERNAMFCSIMTGLLPYIKDDGLAVPTEGIILSAEKAGLPP